MHKRRNLSQEIDRFLPIIALDRLISREKRSLIRIFLLFATFVATSFLALITFAPEAVSIFRAYPEIYFRVTQGAVLLGIALTTGSIMGNMFYYSRAYRDLDPRARLRIPYSVARIVYSRDKMLYMPVFLAHPLGQETMLRLGLDVGVFAQNTSQLVPESSLEEYVREHVDGMCSFRDFGMYLFQTIPDFEEELFKQGVTEGEFRGALEWVEEKDRLIRDSKRWWSREHIRAFGGIGKEWSYGGAHLLRRFAHEISGGAYHSESDAGAGLAQYVEKLETILARATEANALVVGYQGVGKETILDALAYRLRTSSAHDSLRDYAVLVFDQDAFLATFSDREKIEPGLISLLKSARSAGNIILVFPRFVSFLQTLRGRGIDIVALLDPYLVSPEMHIIALSDSRAFHSHLESDEYIMQRFEVVRIEGTDEHATLKMLERAALFHEVRHNIVFTFQAIKAIYESADRYITDGVMPEKAVDLITEIAPYAQGRNVRLVTDNFVHEYVGSKTGVSVGKVGEKERDMLSELEDRLHEYVIGQDKAVSAVADAMRRARAGVSDPSRPYGSFLFLGPTGVGKTETAKALARVIFGSEDKLMRLDMSEYTSTNAADKLIGSFDSATPGVLSNMLRTHSSGVLLLDEFEKTTSQVNDLFLQILDEGVYSDMRGEQVNAHNILFIATSNAASDLIYEKGKSGQDLMKQQDIIVDEIISRNIFRPELLNRFDDVILFHPLQEDHLKQIAELMLERLKDRIHKKGYDLVVNDTLVNLLVEKGYNPEFGARPMRRALQDVIESAIADKIIRDDISKGDTIEFEKSDFV